TANVQLQVGEYVEEGDPVLSLVGSDAVWVVANLKETDLTHLALGQEARLTVDAYPDIEWRARVSSMSPATGAEYALLPPQNASGNWVKVVQRLPVRLDIESVPGAPPLRAGMSVSVRIDTGHVRPLPEILNSARAWIAPATGS
ncbi:MAG: HlyD family efflux transporter periplasmic adaptor subunit, partial [Pseudomonadota bacterium]